MRASSPKATPSSPKKGSPSKVTQEQIEARVKGACTVVATEVNVQPQIVYNSLNPSVVYAWSLTHGADLAAVVKEVCVRRVLIDEGLRVLASEMQMSVPDIFNAMIDDWHGAYEHAQNNNLDLLDVMRTAHNKHVSAQNNTQSSSSSLAVVVASAAPSKPKPKPKHQWSDEHGLDRLDRLLRGNRDGKAEQWQKEQERRAAARSSKVNQKRAESST